MRDLLRAIAKTGGGSGAALLMGVVTMKVLAVTLGPAGVGFFSILRQTVQTAVVLALWNGQMAIIQGIASREDDQRKEFISTIFWVLFVWTVFLCGLIAVGAAPIANWLTRDTHAASATTVRLLIVPIMMGAIWTFFLSVLNGYRIVGRAALIQVTNFFVIAALAYPASVFARQGRHQSLALLLGAGSIAAAILGLILVWRARIVLLVRPRLSAQSRVMVRGFAAMAGSLVISGVVSFWVPLQIRTMTVAVFGLVGAGIFDVAWTLSMAYVLIILTSFSSYYLPALSEISDRTTRLDLMRNVFRVASILVVPLITIVIVFKPLVVTLLYSQAFLPATHIIRWMLIGDYFKVLSWVFSFTMIAYVDMKTFLWTEVLWGAMSLSGGALSLYVFRSLEGIGAVFAILYVLYFAYTAYYVRSRHGFSLTDVVGVRSLAGLGTIIAATLQTWSATSVNWPFAILWVGIAGLASSLFLTPSERVYFSAFLRRRLHTA